MIRPIRHRAFRCLVAVWLLLVGMVSMASTGQPAPQPLQVVASFSILADMTRVLGGAQVEVIELVPRGGDAHDFEPSPQAMQSLAHADLLVSNGLGFESWLPRLLDAVHHKGEHVVAAQGVQPRRMSPLMDAASPQQASASYSAHHDSHAGQWDPHAWQDLKNGMVYARNISAGLQRVDPEHAAYYQQRQDRYLKAMRDLDDKLRQTLSTLPVSHRHVITAHDAFGYFGQAYGLTFMAAAGLSAEAEPSAREFARLVDLARRHEQVGLFTEQGANPNLVHQLAAETGAPVGGPLYADTLSDKEGPAASYLQMFEWNAQQLISTLKPD